MCLTNYCGHNCMNTIYLFVVMFRNLVWHIQVPNYVFVVHVFFICNTRSVQITFLKWSSVSTTMPSTFGMMDFAAIIQLR